MKAKPDYSAALANVAQATAAVDAEARTHTAGVKAHVESLQAELEQLEKTVEAQIAIIKAHAEQTAVLRGVVWAMLNQASMDETDQTEAGNPWLAIKKKAAAMINPHIKRLNELLGVKAEAQPEKQNSIVLATSIVVPK